MRLLALLLAFAGAASAQSPPPGPFGAGALNGVVVDSMGVAVPEATVYLVELKRTTRARENGTFRFDGLKAGTYAIGARAIGYVGLTGSVTVGADGGSVIIEMTRLSNRLPSIITTASRGGLSGVIGDTSYRALPGVTVKVLGSGAGHAVTNEAGEFFLPVKPGQYMVRLDRPGFRRQIMSVTVPADEGRQIAAWLAPQSGAAAIREGIGLFDLEQRLMRRSPMWTKLYTREDLARLRIADATDAVQRFSGRRPDSWDCAYVDGDRNQQLPLWAIAADEIELLEAGASRTMNRGRTSIAGNASMVSRSPFQCEHWVWLRK